MAARGHVASDGVFCNRVRKRFLIKKRWNFCEWCSFSCNCNPIAFFPCSVFAEWILNNLNMEIHKTQSSLPSLVTSTARQEWNVPTISFVCLALTYFSTIMPALLLTLPSRNSKKSTCVFAFEISWNETSPCGHAYQKKGLFLIPETAAKNHTIVFFAEVDYCPRITINQQ